jgi:CxxC-x17-CxxC domain-containing protein
MDFEDRHLQCTTCGADFLWAAGEQQFFAERGLDHLPKRCPACKRRRHAKRVEAGDGAQSTFEAQCSNCGRRTTVPFRPSTGRPVFCRSCFEHRRQAAIGR